MSFEELDKNLKSNESYGKYITKSKDKFKVQKFVDGKIIGFGYYDTLEEAKKARDKFESENWQYVPKESDIHRNIHKTPRGYAIFKRIDGDMKHFGTFRTIEEALEEKERLIANNWELKKDEFDHADLKKNIQFDGNYYTIEKFAYNEIRVYGVFKNKDLALKEREKLSLNYWVAPYRLKTREYPYGENIVPYDFLFNVEFYQDNELKEFGPFFSFGEAVNKCCELEGEDKFLLEEVQDTIDSDENIKEEHNFLQDIYDQIDLYPEPQVPFPQADVFEIFVEICKRLYSKGSLTREEIRDDFEINPRQYNFYISAGEYLGLIERKNTTNKLSDLGLEVFSGDSETINLDLTFLILEHKPFYDVLGLYLESGEIPTSDEIFEVLKENEIYNIGSEVTLRRRATSVRSWIKWIVKLYDDENVS